LFDSSADSLRQEIKKITGVNVREAAVEVEPTTGAVVKAFTNGTVVQVFLLADSVTASTRSEDGRNDEVRPVGKHRMRSANQWWWQDRAAAFYLEQGA
jgi:hypothetical protein